MVKSGNLKINSSVLVDFWYGRELTGIATQFSSGEHSKKKCNIFSPFIKVYKLLSQSKSYDYLAPNWYEWGRLLLIVNSLLPKPRKIILFEVIDYGAVGSDGLKGKLLRLIIKLTLAPAMRRTVRLLQVMTEDERNRFIKIYGLDPSVVKTIHWPLLGWTNGVNSDGAEMPDGDYIFSSGRAACDWKTLFTAADSQDWKLVVVCGKEDLEHVRSISKNINVEIHSEIPKTVHDNLLKNAKICVISLREEFKSSGQVRLGAAIELGVPVVASEVAGLNGYLRPDVNALTYAASDAQGLRNAVNKLLADENLSKKLCASAIESCSGYSKLNYFDEIRKSIQSIAI